MTTAALDAAVVLQADSSGPMVSDEDADRLFEPFLRLGAQRTARDGGLGLGLSIVEAIATAHGGEVEASPGREGEPLAELRLPREPEPAAPLTALPGPC